MKDVSFEFIRYANCWEDPDVLLSGLNCAPHATILSIGSAGDNSFSLLMKNPEKVVAVDLSAAQLHLVELKKAAIKKLDRRETLCFLGFRESENRNETYEKLKAELSIEARKYWDNQQEAIKNGVVYAGKFEKYFRVFSQKLLPLIHSKKTVAELLRPKSTEEQEKFYHEKWNTWRWRLLFRIFFSKYVMGKFGRDPQFLKQVKIPVSQYIFGKAEAHLTRKNCTDNFMLNFILTGKFGNLLPHYLREENFETIKNQIDKIEVAQGYAEEIAELNGPFDGYNLSNIFEYLDEQTFTQVAQKLSDNLNSGGSAAYWNLMVPRLMSEIPNVNLNFQTEKSEALTRQDRGFFYNRFIIELKP